MRNKHSAKGPIEQGWRECRHRRAAKSVASREHRDGGPDLGGGVALEKLREEIARQEKWTSGYRLIVNTIIGLAPVGETGRPDLGMIPAHTREVLARAARSLAREDAILERLRAELRGAEDTHGGQVMSECSPGEAPLRHISTKNCSSVADQDAEFRSPDLLDFLVK